METTTTTVNLKREALKNGAIWGGINIVIFLAVWYTVPSLMTSPVYALISAIIGILLAVFFCIDMRKKAGGYWSYSEALWPILGMFLMNMTMVFLFTNLFGKFIDPTYPAKMKEYTMESTMKMMESMGVDETTLEKTRASTEESLEKQFNPTFAQGVQAYGLVAIMYFVFALIFALIFKRNNPNPFAEPVDERVQEG